MGGTLCANAVVFDYGMAKTLSSTNPCAKQLFETANDFLDFAVSDSEGG
ncbi:MAG: hypothetical protein FD128_2142 [Hyphomonadaceae bacterium]|nr:MAG: hypothetical protein FD128_2142 [Hyphomonadaceae bacterium]